MWDQIGQLVKGYSLLRGKLYTIIGFVIIGISLYLMIDAKSVTQDGLSLLFVGITLSGINHGEKTNTNSNDNPPS